MCDGDGTITLMRIGKLRAYWERRCERGLCSEAKKDRALAQLDEIEAQLRSSSNAPVVPQPVAVAAASLKSEAESFLSKLESGHRISKQVEINLMRRIVAALQ